MTTFYLVRGLRPSAEPPEVKAPYHSLARERYPDQGGDPGAFAELRQAYPVGTPRQPAHLKKLAAQRGWGSEAIDGVGEPLVSCGAEHV